MKRFLKNARLYLVLDAQVNDYHQLMTILKQAVAGGIDIVQLRDKMGTTRQALKFLQEARRYLRGRVPLIVNDRIDWALAAGADGVHVGQEDLPLRIVRKLVGPRMIIGVSCQTMAHARRAEQEGADYLGFGSVFKTLTKPERSAMDARLMRNVSSAIKTPTFFIGGIDRSNVAEVCRRGARRVAVTRAVSLSQDVRGAIKSLKIILEQYPF